MLLDVTAPEVDWTPSTMPAANRVYANMTPPEPESAERMPSDSFSSGLRNWQPALKLRDDSKRDVTAGVSWPGRSGVR